jgi:TetR/AcrR family tetracycline transcriptional repressor
MQCIYTKYTAARRESCIQRICQVENMSRTTERKHRSASQRARASANRTVKSTTLGRSTVVREALELIDRDGVDRFSIRRLADRLGVTPMALYNHVSSKRDLLQAVAEQVVTEAKYHTRDGDWKKVARGCFRAIRKACLAHPGAVVLVESAEQLPATVFKPMELTLSALQTAGFQREDALRAYFVLMTFTLGQMKTQLKGWSGGVDRTAALRDGRISEADFPAVVQARTERWDFDKFFEFGLSIILAGLEARLHRVGKRA